METTKTEILQHYQNSIGRFNSRLVNKSSNNQDMHYHATFELTSFLPEYRTLIERLKILKYDIIENPICKQCGIDTPASNDVGVIFQPYCSRECAFTFKKGIPIVRDEEKAKVKRKQTMIEKYGVAYNSQREEVKDKLGTHCSDPEFRKRQSDIQKAKNPTIQYDILDCKTTLYTMNKIYSIKQISNMSNCSPEKVQQQFKLFNLSITPMFTSNEEHKIKNLLNVLNIEYRYNVRRLLSARRELDIVIDSHGIAIEVNGVYWHSEYRGKDKQYHLTKTNECEDQNIQLLHFWDYEINNKFDIVEDIIKSKLGLNHRIYARKCEIRDVSSNESKFFINENHIQGNVSSSIRKGLYYNDELICIATFSKPRFDNTCDLELIRFCSKNGYTVVGGFSKLLKTIDPKLSILSYANRRISNGNVYEKCGFEFIRNTDPGFVYLGLKNQGMISRHKDRRPLDVMRKEGWTRVFDCGNKVYIKR